MNMGRFRDQWSVGVLWEDVVDGSEGEHDEGEGGVGGVEAVGRVDDEPYPAIESFVAGVVDAESHGGEDPGGAVCGSSWRR